MQTHERLIEQAAAQGWAKSTAASNWRAGFRRATRERYWRDRAGEDVQEIIDLVAARPDAWRITIEGPETPDAEWSHPVMVLEFLEVEVTNRINEDKRDHYRDIWGMFDGTDFFHFRVWRMDRFGYILPYVVDINTAYDSSMPA